MHGLGAQARARLGAGVEEHQLESVTPAFAAQLGVDAEQKLEHWPAAHGLLLLRIGRKADGDGAAVHGVQPFAYLLGRRNALAGDDGVFYSRQFSDDAPAGGDHQRVVVHRAAGGVHGTAVA